MAAEGLAAVAKFVSAATNHGMRILSVYADIFSFADALDWAHPCSMRYEFGDNTTLRVRLATDGESVIVDNDALVGPVDTGQLGRIEVHQLAERLKSFTRGLKIHSTRRILHEGNLRVSVALMVNDDPVLCIWNYGDQLHYGSFPAMAEQDWGNKIPMISGHPV